MPASDGPLVSIVIPAFNAEETIDEAVEGALAQTHELIELIVVDDGSTDNTQELVSENSDSRLQLLRMPHSGANIARNAGLGVATGELIAFLDADDYWYSNKLELQVRSMVASPHRIVLGHPMHYVAFDGRRLGTGGEPVSEVDRQRIVEARFVPFPLSSALFWRSDVLEAGGFDPTLGAAQDLDLYARVATERRFETLGCVLGAYRIHDSSLSAQKFATQRMFSRFVRARIAARNRGEDLSLDDFRSSYRPTARQRHDDLVHRLYRSAGAHASQRRWIRMAFSGTAAFVIGPRYTARRLIRQRGSSYSGRADPNEP